MKVLVEAYGYSKKAKHRIDAVKRATKKLSTRERAELPEDNAIDGHLKTLIECLEAGKCPTEYQRGCQIVIKDAYMEITKGQMSVNEIDAPEAEEAVSVEAVCPQEDVAGQCDENPEEKPEHDLAAAYKFLRDECIEVEMNDMKHLIITVEVSKWESLF